MWCSCGSPVCGGQVGASVEVGEGVCPGPWVMMACLVLGVVQRGAVVVGVVGQGEAG